MVLVQDGPDGVAEASPRRGERFDGRLEQVTVEQSGPVRAVLKLEGRHQSARGSRAWLPFVVRLYFYAGQTSVRLVHTIIYDGDDQKDFIRGLGLEFAVPLREERQNRHVRFSGENGGLWAEPIQPMVGRGGRVVNHPDGGGNVYPDQLDGKRVPDRARYSAREQGLLDDWAVWDAFKLVEERERRRFLGRQARETAERVDSMVRPAGVRARVRRRDASGGLGVSVKNFWQSHPASLEVDGATSGEATLRAWLWSPDAARWTCGTTTRDRTGSRRRMRTCSPASARRWAWPAPAS